MAVSGKFPFDFHFLKVTKEAKKNPRNRRKADDGRKRLGMHKTSNIQECARIEEASGSCIKIEKQGNSQSATSAE